MKSDIKVSEVNSSVEEEKIQGPVAKEKLASKIQKMKDRILELERMMQQENIDFDETRNYSANSSSPSPKKHRRQDSGSQRTLIPKDSAKKY